MPKDTEGKALYATKFYNTHLATHFIKEEQVLAELNGINSILDAAIKEIVEEHVVLRESVAKIKTTNEMEAHLDLLGKSLEKHIRKEERILFPLIEEFVNAAMLLKIENILNHR